MSMLKNRIDLAKLFAEKGFKTGAEIGVFAGYFSEILIKTIPDLRLYCIDSWAVYFGYRDYKFIKSMERAEASARLKLANTNTVIIKEFSMNAVKKFEDNSLDFVYIDGNHEYKFVKQDIEEWTKKVRSGGIVSGDDYYMTRAGNMGVIEAVHEYVDANGYDLQVTPWDPKHELEDNRQPQWWFIK